MKERAELVFQLCNNHAAHMAIMAISGPDGISGPLSRRRRHVSTRSACRTFCQAARRTRSIWAILGHAPRLNAEERKYSFG
jgi:hypothetical protein